MKTYILQKDLPNAKAGMEYRQTDDGQDYCCYDLISTDTWDITYPKKYVENNPEWFKEKEEEKPIPQVVTAKWHSQKPILVFKFGETYHDQIEVSTTRLAEILIAESKGELRTGIHYFKELVLDAEENSL